MLKKRLKSLNGFLLLRTLAIGILPISALTAEANYVLTLDIENQAIHVEVTVTNLPAEEITLHIRAEPINLTITDLRGNPLPFDLRKAPWAGAFLCAKLSMPFTEIR